MYSKDDWDRHCDTWGCCSKKCIIPCKFECHGKAYCEQCRYGYMNIVSKLKLRYTKEELELLNDNCVYVKFALEEDKNHISKRTSIADKTAKVAESIKIDTKLKDLIKRCQRSVSTGNCEDCECTERECLDALMDEFTNRRLGK